MIIEIYCCPVARCFCRSGNKEQSAKASVAVTAAVTRFIRHGVANATDDGDAQ